MTLHVCGSVDVEKTRQIIEKIYSSPTKPTTPKPARGIVNRTPPTSLIKVFQDELNTLFSFSVISMDPIEPLTTFKQAQTEMILSVLGTFFLQWVFRLTL